MIKVMLVFGTRPEAIKMAPIIKELSRYPDRITPIVCVTAQHREMLDQVLSIFDIHPDYDLNIMKGGQDLYDITSAVLTGMREVLTENKPDIILVHGDTTTSTAAALAAFYKQIPVGHVEAGLRTRQMYSPFPEEINRQITSRITSFHFAPTEQSAQNLRSEMVDAEKIFITGNTVIDALHIASEKIAENEETRQEIEQTLLKAGLSASSLESWESGSRKMILITGHRRENFGQGFVHICQSIQKLASTYPNIDFVYPVHLNPQVQSPVYEYLSKQSNIYLIAPQEYLSFIWLMKHAYLILTDSGGIQEEAPGLGKPVLVMREMTERPEAVKAGTVELVGTDPERIVGAFRRLIDNKEAYEKMSQTINPYGDGKAAKRISEILMEINL